jgi:hypothetical protein
MELLDVRPLLLVETALRAELLEPCAAAADEKWRRRRLMNYQTAVKGARSLQKSKAKENGLPLTPQLPPAQSISPEFNLSWRKRRGKMYF